MAKLPDLTSRIKIDDRDLDRAQAKLRQFGGAVQGVGRSSSGLARLNDELGRTSNLGDIGRKLTLGTTPLVLGFAAATKAASDLNEASSLTGDVFGENRAEVDAFVKTTADGLGQSERAAREATATFGGLLQNLGFTGD